MKNKNDKMMKKINEIKKIELSNDITDNSIIQLNDEYNIKKTETFSSIQSDNSTLKSGKTVKTVESKPFNKELDFDLPEFTSTKYATASWKISHSIFYFLYSWALLASNLLFVLSGNLRAYNIIGLFGHICYFISSFLEWFYFKRGCIGYANLNSRLKDNIDYSLKAKILRSEQGWKYFFSFFASIILIYGNIYYFDCNNKSDEENDKGIYPDEDFWNINLVGVMIISLAQILKIDKILIHTRQYMIKNDLSNCLIEIFYYFASLFFGTLYYYNIMYDYHFYYEKLETLYKCTSIGGSIHTIFSSICLIKRYYCSSYDDLNTSDLSNVTL